MPRRAALQVVPRADVPDDGRLADIADQVRQLHAAARIAQAFAFEAHLAIGRLLLEARLQLRADRAYGAWLRAQGFPFNRQWAWVLAEAARQEPRVRAAVTSQLATGSVPNIEDAVAVVRGRARQPQPTWTLRDEYLGTLDMAMEAIRAIPAHEVAEHMASAGAYVLGTRVLSRAVVRRRLRAQQAWAQSLADLLAQLYRMADVEQLPLGWSVDPAGFDDQ